MSQTTYRGQDRAGTARGGALSPDMSAAEFVESRFRAGWRWLDVTSEGVRVGEIGRAYDRPEWRTWWAES